VLTMRSDELELRFPRVLSRGTRSGLGGRIWVGADVELRSWPGWQKWRERLKLWAANLDANPAAGLSDENDECSWDLLERLHCEIAELLAGFGGVVVLQTCWSPDFDQLPVFSTVY